MMTVPQVDPTSQWFEVTFLNRLPKGLIRSQQSALSRSIFSKRSKSPRVTKVNVCPTCYMVTEMVHMERHTTTKTIKHNESERWKQQMRSSDVLQQKMLDLSICKTSTFTQLIPQVLGHGNCITLPNILPLPPGLPGACRAPHTMDIRLKMRRSGVIHHGRHLRDIDTTGHHIGTSGIGMDFNFFKNWRYKVWKTFLKKDVKS